MKIQKFNEASIDTSISSVKELENIDMDLDDIIFSLNDNYSNLTSVLVSIRDLNRTDSGLNDNVMNRVSSKLSEVQNILDDMLSDINRYI